MQYLIKSNFIFDTIIKFQIDTDVAVKRLLPEKIRKEEELFKIRELNELEKKKRKSGNDISGNETEDEKEEFPEDPEDFYSEELNEEGEKESERINEIINHVENNISINISEVDAGRCLRPIIYKLRRILRPYIQCHDSILTNTIPIDKYVADMYLEKGIKKLSKFG